MANVLSLAGLIASMGSMTTTSRTREDMFILLENPQNNFAALQSSARVRCGYRITLLRTLTTTPPLFAPTYLDISPPSRGSQDPQIITTHTIPTPAQPLPSCPQSPLHGDH